MKVSIDWLKELVNIDGSIEELIELLPLRTIGTKEVTKEFIELDMKGYNRADLLSMRGVAYEAAAITDSKVSFVEEEVTLNQLGENLEAKVEDMSDCFLYCVAKIEGLSVAKSDPASIKRLTDAGMREVNNVVDITNLVMLEYGQPLHAFDGKIGNQIEVRRAQDGEELETLDDVVRKLESSDLVIATEQAVIGLAGVLGGKRSEVGEETTSIVLEAAIFEPKLLRQTGNRLNIHSEAAKRFYHGLTKKRLMQALHRAIEEYKDIGGRLTDLKIVGGNDDKKMEIKINPTRISQLMGVDLEKEEIKKDLEKLYFEVDEDVRLVKPPFWRLDCETPVDIVEEVARMYGYENIPAKELVGEKPERVDQSNFEFEKKVREELVELGFNEALTYSFVASKVREVLNLDSEVLVRVANPISSETEYMRESIWPGLVEKAIENLKYRKTLAIFEIGERYIARDGEEQEVKVASVLVCDGTDNPLAGLAGVIKMLGKRVGRNWSFEQSNGLKNLHPVRQIAISLNGKKVGIGGEVNRKVVDKLGGSSRMAVVEIEI